MTLTGVGALFVSSRDAARPHLNRRATPRLHLIDLAIRKLPFPNAMGDPRRPPSNRAST
jgi:hypothetical protein